MSETIFIRILVLLLGLFMAMDRSEAATLQQSDPHRESQLTDKRAEDLFRQSLLHTDGSLESQRLIEEAVRIWTQLHSPDKAARALIQLGQSYMREKRFLISLGFYKQALDVKSIASAQRDE